MRSVSSAFKTWLEGGVLSMAYCVKLTRRDSTILGFTTLDTNLTVSGVTYEASNGFSASSVKSSVGAGVDNLDIIGLLRSDRINEADIRAGRYDGATVEIFAVNWQDLTMGTLVLLVAEIGQVRTQDAQFTAELRSLSQRLQQQIGDLTGPLCRVKRLGDTQCKKVLTSFTHTGSVASVAAQNDVTIGSMAQSSGYFDYGTILFTSGANNGLEKEVKTHTLSSGQARLVLQEPFPYAIAPGDNVTLIAGCDRRRSTCQTKYSNVINFRGEPDIPGFDTLLQRGRGGQS